MKTLLLKATGDSLILTHDAPLELDALQGYVGGYIELVYARAGERNMNATNAAGVEERITIPANAQIIVDEEGMLKSKPINLLAAAAYGSLLVGDAIIPLDWRLE